jgi:hypothetical protein
MESRAPGLPGALDEKLTMPSAVTAVFGGDSRPMEAEYAKMETRAKRFGKTLSDLNAEENAQLLRNSAALKKLIAERKAAADELSRYVSSSSQSGFGPNPRSGMAADDAAWQRKYAEAKMAKAGARNLGADAGAFALRVRQEAALATEAAKVESLAAKTVKHAGGLNLIIRETLVVFREIGRGNWTRVPGSLSLIAQGFSQLKGIPLALMGAWAVAIGGIVASFFIFYHRVKSLTEALRTTLESTFNPDHIARYLQKVEILNELQKDVAETARQVKEAHDGVESSLDRQLDLTKDNISYQQQLLEIQKQNELAQARTPFEREQIEKRYSEKSIKLKKEERDAEVKKMQDEVRQLGGPNGEIAKTNAEIKRLTEGDFVSAPRDEQILKQRQEASAAYDDYRKQLVPGARDSREFSMDKDRKIIDAFNKKKSKYNKLVDENSLDASLFMITDTDRAKADAARQRLSNSTTTQQSLNAWTDAKGDRDRARARVKELEDKVKAEEKRLAELGPRGGGVIEDAIKRNLEKDKQDLALEKARLARTDNPGAHERGYGLNAQQRLGAYAATPFDFRKMENAAVETARNTGALAHPPRPAPGKQPARVGGLYA